LKHLLFRFTQGIRSTEGVPNGFQPTPLYLEDESQLTSLHGSPGRSQLQQEQEICFDTETSLTGLASGHQTNVNMVTAWAMLLASYTSEGNVNIVTVKESGIDRILNLAIQWWMPVAQFTRYVEDQLVNVLSEPSIEATGSPHKEIIERSMGLLISIRQHTIGESRIARDENVLSFRCRTFQNKIHFDSSLAASSEDNAFSALIHRQWQHMFQEICRTDGGERSIADLKVITTRDLEQIWSWNARVPQGDSYDCIHHIFMRRARRHPQLPAVCGHDGNWTYFELDNLSTRLAHALIRQNLRPDQIVIIYMEKSKWVPVAQLAIMKAGCASTVLDASLPLQRLKVISDLVCASHILASAMYAQAAAELSTDGGITIVDMDSTHEWPPAQPAFLPVVSPTQKCYVVFTSGSTGTPKGVVITHQNYTSAILTQNQELGFREFDRVFDFTSYAFDVSRTALMALPSARR
jgi:hypothetical protein